jgi:hypothetical protein
MSEPPAVDPADEPLDADDDRILAELAAVYEVLDPPPEDLDERARFALRVGDLDFEISRLYDLSAAGAGARDGEPTRTVTFESQTLTIMVTVSDIGGGRRHLEGWLAPPDEVEVELRVGDAMREQSFRVAAANGRFVFDDVPSGLARFHVHRASRGLPDITSIVTSPIAI